MVHFLQVNSAWPYWWKINFNSGNGLLPHYNDVIMSTMTSQITGISIVYSTVCSGAHQRKHQGSASLAFVQGIYRWPVNSPHKGPVMQKMPPFDDVVMWQHKVIITWTRLTKIRDTTWCMWWEPTGNGTVPSTKDQSGWKCVRGHDLIIVDLVLILQQTQFRLLHRYDKILLVLPILFSIMNEQIILDIGYGDLSWTDLIWHTVMAAWMDMYVCEYTGYMHACTHVCIHTDTHTEWQLYAGA